MSKAWFFFSIIVTFFSVQNVSSEIIECTNLEELTSLVPNGSHLFLEIYNVLLNPKEEVATTAFFDYLKQNLLTDGNDPDQIANKLYPLWVKVQKKSKCEPSDRNLESYLNALANKNVTTLALSHRGPQLAYHTLDCLHDQNIHFSSSSPFDHNHIIEPELATFYEGMLLLHPVCDKGEYLSKFLSLTDVLPQKVVCVDYQLVNLVRISQEMELLNIPFLGIYYRNGNCNFSDYTMQIGNLQLEYIDKILSDETAKILLGKK